MKYLALLTSAALLFTGNAYADCTVHQKLEMEGRLNIGSAMQRGGNLAAQIAEINSDVCSSVTQEMRLKGNANLVSVMQLGGNTGIQIVVIGKK